MRPFWGEMTPHGGPVLEHLGDVYAKLNRIDDAKKYWAKALDKDQKNSALRQKIERGAL